MSQRRVALNRTVGRKAGFCSMLLLMLFLLSGCNSESEYSGLQQRQPIISRLNNRFHIAVEFYGELIGPDSEPSDHLLVDHILIRDTKKGMVERFIPEDADTLQNSFGYFTNVWSPDNAYMALPRGRFEGFALFSSKTVMETLRQGRYSDTIEIRLATDNSTKLWHEFIRWKPPHLFHFSAGLSGKQFEFIFDPSTGEVHGPTDAISAFTAITKSGISQILPSNIR